MGRYAQDRGRERVKEAGLKRASQGHARSGAWFRENPGPARGACLDVLNKPVSACCPDIAPKSSERMKKERGFLKKQACLFFGFSLLFPVCYGHGRRESSWRLLRRQDCPFWRCRESAPAHIPKTQKRHPLVRMPIGGTGRARTYDLHDVKETKKYIN